MSAEVPDLTDIVMTYIKELWPLVDIKRSGFMDDESVFSIEVNSHVVGITCYGVFASYNFVKQEGEYVKPTDPNFFTFIKHWTKVKAGLDDPKTSSV